MTTIKDLLRDNVEDFLKKYKIDVDSIDEEEFLDEIVETIKERLAKFTG